MTSKEFIKLSDPGKLKFMKQQLDHLSHDFQHQEIVEIDKIGSADGRIYIVVWEKGVNTETWPKFTDYFHQQVKYNLIDGHFIFAG